MPAATPQTGNKTIKEANYRHRTGRAEKRTLGAAITTATGDVLHGSVQIFFEVSGYFTQPASASGAFTRAMPAKQPRVRALTFLPAKA